MLLIVLLFQWDRRLSGKTFLLEAVFESVVVIKQGVLKAKGKIAIC